MLLRCVSSAVVGCVAATTSRCLPAATSVMVQSRRHLLKHGYKRLRHQMKEQGQELNEDNIPEGVLIANNAVEFKKGLYRVFHPVEVQIKYMESEAYKQNYRGAPPYVWYKRRVKGQPKMAGPQRLYCISKDGTFNTNNPCAVCRDEYLWFDYRNPKLLQMFLQPNSEELINPKVTGLCQEQQQRLQAEVIRAKEAGTLEWWVPHRHYDYKRFWPEWKGVSVNELTGVSEGEPLTTFRPKRHIIYEDHLKDTHQDWDPYWVRWERFTRRAK